MFCRPQAAHGSALAHSIGRLRVTIDEPDVSLTDLGLALEVALFAAIHARQSTRVTRLRRWAVAFFGSAAVASLAGAIDHAFLRRDGRARAHDLVWTTSLSAIGATALSLAAMGAELGFDRRTARRVTFGAATAAVAYAVTVISGRREFLIAMFAYVAAASFLLIVLVRCYVTIRNQGSLLGIVAIVLAFAAAAVQRLEISVHHRHFDHNALYHLIQAVSFAVLFTGVRRILDELDQDQADDFAGVGR